MALVLRLTLALSVLTILGGIVSVVGFALQTSPSVQMSPFLLSLGSGVGSVVLGVIGIVVVQHLAGAIHLDRLARRRDGVPASETEDLA